MRFFRCLVVLFLLLFTLFELSEQTLAYGIYTGDTYGNDFSYPQCNLISFPQQTFNIVGVTSGRAFQHNQCFNSEYLWTTGLATTGSVYMNLNAPIGTTASKGMTGPFGNCSKSDKICQSKNYGYNAAQDAYSYALGQGAMWWLDIETFNSWSSNAGLNRNVIDGAVRFFTDKGIPVGIYSTPNMWNKITGNYQNKLPTWTATTNYGPYDSCLAVSFTGGQTYLVQYRNPTITIDSDYACK